MRAELVTRFKDVRLGEVMELVIWRVPDPVPPAAHHFKCRAADFVDGVRVIGFDNERGKGDHCHVGAVEHPYVFTSPSRLVEDFIAAVKAVRGGASWNGP